MNTLVMCLFKEEELDEYSGYMFVTGGGAI